MEYRDYTVDVVNTDGKWYAVVSRDGKTVYSSDCGYNSRTYSFADGLHWIGDNEDYN